MSSQPSNGPKHEVDEDNLPSNDGERGHRERPTEQSDVSPGQSADNARSEPREEESEATAADEDDEDEDVEDDAVNDNDDDDDPDDVVQYDNEKDEHEYERPGQQENARSTRKPSKRLTRLVSEYLEHPRDTDSSSGATRVSQQDQLPDRHGQDRGTIDDEVHSLVSYIFGRTGRSRGQRGNDRPQDARMAPSPSRQDPESLQPTPTFERDLISLQRIATQRSQHANTVGEGPEQVEPPTDEETEKNMLRRLRSLAREKPLPPFGAGKPYPPKLPKQEEYVVEFNGPDDPTHPRNWPLWRKTMACGFLTFTSFIGALISSMYSPTINVISKKYQVSPEVGRLGLSLYVVGYATGPLLWGPLSELHGRRIAVIIPIFGTALFEFAVGAAKDIQTIIICRFFAGFFNAGPLTVVPAAFSDVFDNKARGIAVSFFSMSVFVGPTCGPFIGGFITMKHNMGWRWTAFLSGIFAMACCVFTLFFVSESYPPKILVGKAAELRRRTKNWGIHAKQEEVEISLGELITKNFLRPIRLLCTEPIIAFITIYMSFVYGLQYCFLTAYPVVFEEGYKMNPGVGGLPYIGLVVGMFLAGFTIIAYQPWYNMKLRQNNDLPLPEWRLPPVMAGSVSFAIGLFWFGWTGFKGPKIHWIVPTLSGLCTGFGFLSIFQQLINYLVDAYVAFAASAIAANTMLRSFSAAAFPLFTVYMYHGMHIQWASSLLGFVAVALIPIPFVLYFFGSRIRERSKFAMSADRNIIQDTEKMAETK